jgi:hypothetical protein
MNLTSDATQDYFCAMTVIEAPKPVVRGVIELTPSRQMVTGLASAGYEASDGGEANYRLRHRAARLGADGSAIETHGRPQGYPAIKARFPETRIAIVTHYDKAELRVEAKRVGACAHVHKENLQRLPGILIGGAHARKWIVSHVNG